MPILRNLLNILFKWDNNITIYYSKNYSDWCCSFTSSKATFKKILLNQNKVSTMLSLCQKNLFTSHKVHDLYYNVCPYDHTCILFIQVFEINISMQAAIVQPYTFDSKIVYTIFDIFSFYLIGSCYFINRELSAKLL